MKTQRKIQSSIGPLYLVASEKGLQGIFWDEQPMPSLKERSSLMAKLLDQTEQELSEFFAGKRKQFDIPLDIEGSPFQKRVWKALCNIPYGTTTSYKAIAADIKNKNASRAVGNANGKNPLSIIIPCHRVIAADGSIGGYGGGLHRKKQLLKIEADHA